MSGAPNELYAKYQDHDFAFWFVVTAQSSGGPPDAATCETVREQYGLTMSVLYDPSGLLESELGMPPNSAGLVLSHGNVIEMKSQAGHAAAPAALESIYGF